MKKLFTWAAALLMLLIGFVYLASSNRLDQTFSIQVEDLAIPNDPASIAHGKHIAITRGCADCHQKDFSGEINYEDPTFGRVTASNLTSGKGGISYYSDNDWVQSIRHGVAPDGKGLIMMPSQEYYQLSDKDLGALIAYLKSLPPVDNQLGDTKAGPLFRLFIVLGQMNPIAAEDIDHEKDRPDSPVVGVTADYGKYLASGCALCHADTFVGGRIPGAPLAANLTPAGGVANWTETDFFKAMRTGITPDGRYLDPAYMIWQAYSQLTDNELKSIWLYLKSLPAQETATQ